MCPDPLFEASLPPSGRRLRGRELLTTDSCKFGSRVDGGEAPLGILVLVSSVVEAVTATLGVAVVVIARAVDVDVIVVDDGVVSVLVVYDVVVAVVVVVIADIVRAANVDVVVVDDDVVSVLVVYEVVAAVVVVFVDTNVKEDAGLVVGRPTPHLGACPVHLPSSRHVLAPLSPWTNSLTSSHAYSAASPTE